MRRFLSLLFVLVWAAFACKPPAAQSGPVLKAVKADANELLSVIAFGSCNRQDLPQDMWEDIVAQQPDLWIWLGDNIYGDTEDMALMAKKYRIQKGGEGYQRLRARAQIIGIWDDHDYGVNDGDQSYPQKEASKQLMLDFLDVPAEAEARQRPGAYQAYLFGPAGQRVKVLLLDGRTFRDALQKGEGDQRRRYLPNPVGDILGEAQWKWLEEELAKNDAEIHLIGCGIQFLSEEHAFEKWANFPAARQRLFDVLEKTQPNRALLLSGDRHIAEVSQMQLDGLPYPLFDLTSSGLTHSYTSAGDEPNKYRQGPLVNQKNFGVLRIDWSQKNPAISLEIRGLNNEVFISRPLL